MFCCGNLEKIFKKFDSDIKFPDVNFSRIEEDSTIILQSYNIDGKKKLFFLRSEHIYMRRFFCYINI